MQSLYQKPIEQRSKPTVPCTRNHRVSFVIHPCSNRFICLACRYHYALDHEGTEGVIAIRSATFIFFRVHNEINVTQCRKSAIHSTIHLTSHSASHKSFCKSTQSTEPIPTNHPEQPKHEQKEEQSQSILG